MIDWMELSLQAAAHPAGCVEGIGLRIAILAGSD